MQAYFQSISAWQREIPMEPSPSFCTLQLSEYSHATAFRLRQVHSLQLSWGILGLFLSFLWSITVRAQLVRAWGGFVRWYWKSPYTPAQCSFRMASRSNYSTDLALCRHPRFTCLHPCPGWIWRTVYTLQAGAVCCPSSHTKYAHLMCMRGWSH